MKYHIIASLSLLAISQTLIAAQDDHKGNKPEPALVQKIEPFKLVDKAGKFVLVLDEAGNLTLNGEKSGSITASGVFLGNDGKKIAQLNTDGTFVGSNGKNICTLFPNGNIKGPPNMAYSWKNNQLWVAKDVLLFLDKPTDINKRLASCLLVAYMTLTEQPAPKAE